MDAYHNNYYLFFAVFQGITYMENTEYQRSMCPQKDYKYLTPVAFPKNTTTM